MKCEVSKKCGACRYIEVPYEEQLEQKKQYVERLFPGIPVNPVIGMKNPLHYRHKIYCAFGNDKNGRVYAGLFEENSHKIVRTSKCLIQDKNANAIIRDLCQIATELKIPAYDEDDQTGVLRYGYLRVSHSTKQVLLTIVIGSKFLPKEKVMVEKITKLHPEITSIVLNFNHGTDSMVLGKFDKVIYGRGTIIDTIDGIKFRISSKSFYQVNPVQTEVLYQTALAFANIQKTDTVLDVCCGIGTISLLAARKASFVLGVEINAQAIKDANSNAKLNKIDNVEFITMDAEQFIHRLGETPNVVFLDPPRSGFHESFIQTLSRLQPDRIVYISCDPETQARDTKIFKKYGYRIKNITPVDNFCFTRHVETVCLLSKKA